VAKKRSNPGLNRLSGVDSRLDIRHINSSEFESDPSVPIGIHMSVYDETGHVLELFIGRGRGHFNRDPAGYDD